METLLMGRRCCYVLYLIFIYYSQQSSCATIEVGGPPPDYATWVSSQSVVVDDILVFKFPPGYHNVYSLPTEAAYTNCDQSKATELNDGKTGSYFVVEGLGSHCQGARNWRWWLRVAKLLQLFLFLLLHQQKKPLHLLQAVLRLQHLCSECQHQLLLLVHL
ncbi:hypothetical protein BDL97_17G082700 [Sphagnum fallax]|nr:hypothetical protein BDL97_17G082700 [Sphagnum fallax]